MSRWSRVSMQAWDLYQAWVAARDEADLAYRDWCHATPAGRRDAYARYRAAADRADVAGDRFAGISRLSTSLIVS